MRALPTKELEMKMLKSGYDFVIGVDEVGMGCLAGPVVVCVVSFDKNFYKRNNPIFNGIKDSKLLSAKQRELLVSELLKEKGMTHVLSFSSPKTIDELNIYQASREAMRKAIKKIQPNKILKTILLIDGNKKVKNLEIDQQAIVKGDQKIFSIACASIIAKVYRDKLMKRYSAQFPAYGFEQHKGYSTKIHQNALKKLGPCPIHRHSFRLKY